MKLQVCDLTKEYCTKKGPLQALSPTSFEVSDAEFVSLIGPSGCGKSTTLYMIAGLEESSSGGILLDGQPVIGPGRDRGMVFQNYTLFPWLNVEDNARFGSCLKAGRDGVATTAQAMTELGRVHSLLDLMGLSNFYHSYPRELSGGMKQRVAIARALAARPKVLLMDEPFGALDAQTRDEMQGLLLLLSRHERTTILFVTHDVEEAIYLSTRILVFSSRPGRIIHEVKVPFGPDRTLDIKLSPEFMRLKRDIVGMLHRELHSDFDREALLGRLVPAANLKPTAHQ
jgi:NitT/TauT family transport system ATP-binding protein